MTKYRYQPTREQIDGLSISLHKNKKGETVGVTIWSDGHWVLDASIMKDKGEEFCRIYTGNRVQPLQFEYFEGNGGSQPFLELRSKKRSK
jgi:hypothetical protein